MGTVATLLAIEFLDEFVFGAREAAWLEVELSREGAARTRFVGAYCLSPADPHYLDSSFRAALERRLRDSVK